LEVVLERAGKSLAPLPQGAAAVFRRLPEETQLALASYSDTSSRVESAKGWVEVVAALLGQRLDQDDAARVGEALLALAKGRGDALVAGGLLGGGLVVAMDVSDPEAAKQGVQGLVDSKVAEFIAAPFLLSASGKLSARSELVRNPAIGQPYSRLRFRDISQPGGPELELNWLQYDDQLAVVLGPAPADEVLLRLMRSSRPPEASSAGPAVPDSGSAAAEPVPETRAGLDVGVLIDPKEQLHFGVYANLHALYPNATTVPPQLAFVLFEKKRRVHAQVRLTSSASRALASVLLRD
jgi:hypothetical protein